MAKPEQIAEFVRWYQHEHLGLAPYGFRNTPVWFEPRPSAEQLAAHFVTLAEFELLSLGNLFSTPDGELIAEGVGLAIPAQFGLDYTLFVDGLKLAAQMQQSIGRKRAGALALLVAGAVALGTIADAR